MKLHYLTILLLVPGLIFAQKKPVKAARQADVKIQKTSLTREQEIQLGKEAAAEVERTMEVLKEPATEAWLNDIGQRLARTPQANAYPFYFKLVNEDSINAFALPGGPMYVNTGLIRAADSEAQVAGVLAHEMSHVALRHGASQMSKAQTWNTIFGVVGAAAGAIGGGQCGLLCQAVQGGGGLLQNSVLSKFSRDLEHDADLNGARMMAAAGYNPIELPHFFEKLESTLGSAAEPKGLQSWFASHPPTPRRVEYVSEDIAFYPQQSYTANTGNFERVRTTVATLPPPKVKPATLLQPVQARSRSGLPSGFQDFQSKGFAIAYPSTWQAGQAPQGGGLFLAPKDGVQQTQKGGAELIAGVMLDYFQPQSGHADLASSTRELIANLAKGDANVKIEGTQSVQVGGKPARVTTLQTKTSYAQDPDQVVYFYTVVRGDLLWTAALAAPRSQAAQFEPLSRQIIGTVQFPD